NDRVLLEPPDEADFLTREIIRGTSVYGVATVQPMLMLERAAEAINEAGETTPRPVKTIPAHFSRVRPAEEEDVGNVFGHPDEEHLYVGLPLDMDTPVCLNLPRFVERSNGIFGKSGTGKTFLTRLVLAGTIHSNQAVNLIFDMHSEYGWQAAREGGSTSYVKGLKQLFGPKVAIFTLDPDSARRRQVPVDFAVQIPYSQIEVEDIALLQDELKLNNTAVETAYQLVGYFKQENWLQQFLACSDLEQLAQDINAHPAALSALHRKLSMLQTLPFVKPVVQDDAVQRMLEHLDKGINVVLEFGQQNRMLTYMLVANILTRRIHRMYVEKCENAMFGGGVKPRPLMITIEEAHKFLNPTAAKQTIFGTIAREMRKFNVTLLIVDQRPSGIDSEVLSQVGTRVTCLLNDEQDINAVLTGVSGASHLRSVLATLDSKQQALLLGHAVPMPVVIRTRSYDEEFYKAVGYRDTQAMDDEFTKLVDNLYGED
ncbi:MAG TPA: ATP-binding protein, partial [Verrucomicrobiae bacterium]|nr:ATP-binding protein [Verrucomicrobiae bacterium]